MCADASSKEWYYLSPTPYEAEPPETPTTAPATPQQVGPLSWEELAAAAHLGSVRPNSLVWGPSLAAWTRADCLPGLFETIAPPVPSPALPGPAPYAGAAPARRRPWLLPVLIPVVALLVVGAAVGTYLGFFFDRGKEITVTATTSVATTGPNTSESAGSNFGLAEYQAPDPGKVVDMPGWGPVPVNRVGVVLAEGQSPILAQALAKALQGQIVGTIEFINGYEIEIPGSTQTDLLAALQKAEETEGVELVFPDLPIGRFTEIWGVRQSPLNDPVYADGRDAGLKLIGAPQAWAYMRGCGLSLSEVHVGVVDDGLYRGTGEYDGDVSVYFPDPNAGELAETSRPYGSHGTMVAGQIAADPNNGGMTGIASPVLGNLLTLSMINNFDDHYSDQRVPAADPNDPTTAQGRDGVARSFGSLVAVLRAVEAGAKIINCSWGFSSEYLLDIYNKEKNGQVPQGTYQAAYSRAEDQAAAFRRFFEKMGQEHPDVLFVCAAGNTGREGQGNLEYPAGVPLPNVISVGDVNNDGTTATSSSRVNTAAGQEFEVTIAAPGHETVQGVDGDGNPVTVGYTDESGWTWGGGGTSAASPQVAAAAALLLALDPDLTAQEIKQILSETARRGPAEVGGKVLAVDQAVLRVINEQRERLGLPAVTGEELEKAGVIDAVAISQDEPNTWMVKAIVQALPSAAGTEITINATTGTKIEGELTQKISAPGETVWLPVVVPNEVAEITVTRADTGAASVIRFEMIDLNGTWAGTLVFTDVKLSPEAQAEVDQLAENPPEELEGCDLSSIAAILEQLKGKPCPLTLEIVANEGGTGSVSLSIDFSPLSESAEPSEMSGVPMTWSGNSFSLSSENGGQVVKMMGQASLSGEEETLGGTISFAAVEEGKTVYTIVGEWHTTKQ